MGTDPDGQAQPVSPQEQKHQLETQIAVVREQLSGLVAEVDRRRHEVLDVRGQLRRHALETALTAAALLGAATGFVWFGIRRARRRERLTSQTDRLRQAISRMIDRPERVAAEPTVPMKILTAAANAAIAGIIKKVLERAGQRVIDHQPHDRTPVRLKMVSTSP